MSLTEPMLRVRYAEKEVARYREDAESWQNGQTVGAADCLLWGDVVAKANFLFQHIIELDLQIHEELFKSKIPDDSTRLDALSKILQEWLTTSRMVCGEIERLEIPFGSIEGADSFRANLAQAQWMLTPDTELFRGDKWVELRDRAVEAHHQGQTEPLVRE